MSELNGAGGTGNGADPEPLSGTAAAADLAARTLRGDLRDKILEFVRRQKQPWSLLNEEQQTGVVNEVTRIAGALVDGAVAIVATRDFPAIVAKVRDCKAGEKGIEAKVVLASHDPFRHALMDSVGSSVQIVLADSTAFYGARGFAAIDRDEPELPLADGERAPEPPDEGENRSDEGPDEVAAPAADGAPAEESNSYNEGYEAGKAGEESDANPYDWIRQHEPEYRAALNWLAGWYQAHLDETTSTLARNDLSAEAVKTFGDLGADAAEWDLTNGAQRTENPLELWMPAYKWWAQGYSGASARAADTPPSTVEPPKRRRGRPRKQGGDQPGAPA